MKKVKFLVNTAYQGPRKEGDVITVPDDFASRWVKNGIAELFDGEDAPEQSEEPEDDVADNVVNENDSEPDLNSMNAKDLFALCKERGIEVEAKKSKEYYIEKLTAKSEE